MSCRSSDIDRSTLPARPGRKSVLIHVVQPLNSSKTIHDIRCSITRTEFSIALRRAVRSHSELSQLVRVTFPYVEFGLRLSTFAARIFLDSRVFLDTIFLLRWFRLEADVSGKKHVVGVTISLKVQDNVVSWMVLPTLRSRRIFKKAKVDVRLRHLLLHAYVPWASIEERSVLPMGLEECTRIPSYVTIANTAPPLHLHASCEITELVDLSQRLLCLSSAPAILFNHATQGYHLLVICTGSRLRSGMAPNMELSQQFGGEPIFGSELLRLYEGSEVTNHGANVVPGYVTILQIFDGPPARVIVTVVQNYPTSIETQGGSELARETSWGVQASHPGRKTISNTAPAGRFVQDITGYVSNISTDLMRSGGFADVRAGTVKSLVGQPLQAVFKVVRSNQANRKVAFRRVEREVNTWLRLRHANILPILGTCSVEGELPVMVSPLCPLGDMNSYLKSCGKSGKELKAIQYSITQQIACGLFYLHGNTPCVVHGDLKGDNILIADDGTVRICDFGLAAMNGEHTASVESLKGTLAWMAPELLEEDDAVHTTESDIWAFACVVIEIFTGNPPYWPKRSPTQIILAISRGEIPQRPHDVSDQLWALMVTCFSFDPTLRPSTKQVFEEVECY